jgi:hypothetical protein
MKGDINIQYRISMGMSVLLIALAGIFDLATTIPFVGTIMGPLFWIIVGIYFWTKGMGVVNGRRLAVSGVSFVAELIPAIQALPTLIVGIIIILLIVRIEDKTGLSIVKPIKKGVTPPRINRIPINSIPGRREPRITENL